MYSNLILIFITKYFFHLQIVLCLPQPDSGNLHSIGLRLGYVKQVSLIYYIDTSITYNYSYFCWYNLINFELYLLILMFQIAFFSELFPIRIVVQIRTIIRDMILRTIVFQCDFLNVFFSVNSKCYIQVKMKFCSVSY